MSHLGGELSRRRSLSNICSNLLTSARFDAASAIHSHHHHQREIPRNKSPLDFGDRAAHGARNKEEAADTEAGRRNGWVFGAITIKQHNVARRAPFK